MIDEHVFDHIGGMMSKNGRTAKCSSGELGVIVRNTFHFIPEQDHGHEVFLITQLNCWTHGKQARLIDSIT